MAVTHLDRSDLRPQAVEAGNKLNFLVVFFLFSLLVPLTVELGPFKLLAYRVVLLILFVPAFVRWMNGQAGRQLPTDFMMIVLSIWVAMAIVVHHGLGSWQGVGIHTAELLGAYLLGRVYVRTPDQFFKVSRYLAIGFVILLPFAIIEALTSQNILLQVWNSVGQAYPDVDHEQRMGLDRVQGPFEHPIHFGVCGGALIGVTFYVLGYGKTAWGRFWRTALIIGTAFFSLSSGPLAAMTVQIGLIGWDVVLKRHKNRWWWMAGLVAFMYVVIDILSNRTPIEVFISYFALNAQTGYGRILIFQWGLQNAIDNPLFGVGFNDWVRPAWMTPSIDMFWIYYAVIAGLPSGILMLSSFITLVVSVIRRPLTDTRLRQYRMGWLVTIVGLFMAGWMVHFWKVPFVLYCFLLGAGSWILSYQPEDDGTDETVTDTKKRHVYTRFPITSGRRSQKSE